MTEKNEKEKITEEKVTKKTEIAEKESTAIVTATAFEEDAGSGLENLTAEDLTIPRLKILQALSPSK